MSVPRKQNALANLLRRTRASDNCESGQTSGTETAGVDVWETWYFGSFYAFYILLGVATMLSQAIGGMAATERLAAVGLSLLLGGWHYFAAHRRAGTIYRNAPAIFLYFAVALTLLAPLIHLDPAYNFMAFILFWQNFSLWGLRYAIPGAVVFSVYMAWANSDFTSPLVIFQSPEAIGYLLISAPVSVVLSLFIASIIRQSRERQSLIGRLEATREELAKEERRAGVLEERGRLAKEIHDTLAQGFISIVTHLEAAEEDGVSENARRHLDQAKQAARENLVEARRLVAALRPEILESSSLPEALERLAERWSESSGIAAEINIAGDEIRLPQDLQITLLRAAQEALSNVGRHAGAKEVSITLSYAGDLIILDVNDDGRGFDPDSPKPRPNGDGGFGLAAMRERVESLGGRLAIESSPGEGTTLAVHLPVSAEQTSERAMEAR